MRRAILLIAIAIGLSCGTEPGASLQIIATLSPNTSCEYELTETTVDYYSQGGYDPWGLGNVRQPVYVMVLGLKNHLQRTDDDAGSGADGKVRQNTRDVTVLGFETCLLDVTDGLNSEIAGAGCDDVPERQRFFVPANLLVQAGGGVAMGQLNLFDESQLQLLFGSSFSLDLIPPRGLITEADEQRDINGDGDQDDTFFDASPGLPDDNQAWGSFPDSGSATVLVKARAVGKLQSGGSIESNWHTFPVQLCIGCSVSFCGLLEPVACPDGSTGLRGFEAEFKPEACFPFQDAGIGGACVETEGCVSGS